MAQNAQEQVFRIRGEFITLDALLKAAGAVGTGGEGKARIQSGEVLVDGEPETRRGRKLRGGELVEADGRKIRLEAECGAPEAKPAS